jgi:hypothetical protein
VFYMQAECRCPCFFAGGENLVFGVATLGLELPSVEFRAGLATKMRHYEAFKSQQVRANPFLGPNFDACAGLRFASEKAL